MRRSYGTNKRNGDKTDRVNYVTSRGGPHRPPIFLSRSLDLERYLVSLRPDTITQSGTSNPPVTNRNLYLLQNASLTSQLWRKLLTASPFMIKLLLIFSVWIFRKPARLSCDTTRAGLGENNSLGGVFVHFGLLSASIIT